MTNMHFPFGDEAACIHTLLTGCRYRAVVNHRGQHFYQGPGTWQGRPVICRLGVPGLRRLPQTLFEEIWCGYYDVNEPDSMLFDETHANVFACVKAAQPQSVAASPPVAPASHTTREPATPAAAGH